MTSQTRTWTAPKLFTLDSGLEAEANKIQGFPEAPAESGTTGDGNPGGDPIEEGPS